MDAGHGTADQGHDRFRGRAQRGGRDQPVAHTHERPVRGEALHDLVDGRRGQSGTRDRIAEWHAVQPAIADHGRESAGGVGLLQLPQPAHPRLASNAPGRRCGSSTVAAPIVIGGE